MLNRTDVRRECHRATFGKGEELQQKGAVRRLNWEKKKEDGFDVVQMDATVRGSGNRARCGWSLPFPFMEKA